MQVDAGGFRWMQAGEMGAARRSRGVSRGTRRSRGAGREMAGRAAQVECAVPAQVRVAYLTGGDLCCLSLKSPIWRKSCWRDWWVRT